MKFKELAWGAFVFRWAYDDTRTYQPLATNKEFLTRLQSNPSLEDFDKLQWFLVHYGVRFAPKALGRDYDRLWPQLKPHIHRLAGESLVKCNLNNSEIHDQIVGAYSCLGNAWGGNTVVAKVLHFFNIALFVMWDRKIYSEYSQGKSGADAYLEFLKAMQKEAIEALDDFERLSVGKPLEEFLSEQLVYKGIRPLTKFIDDYYWVTITKEWPSTIPNWLTNLFIQEEGK
jgi:hypothetical protein